MRILTALAFALYPLTAAAQGIVFEVEVRDHESTPQTSEMDVMVEEGNLKLEVRSGEGKPNKDVVLIRRVDGGVTVILVDHLGRIYGEADYLPGGSGIGLMPTGRMEMAPGGIKLHVGGAPEDLWLQIKKTGDVAELLQWIALLDEVSRKLGPDFPEPFEDGFLDGEMTWRERGRRTLDPEAFEPPSGYKRRTMLFSGSGSSGSSGTPNNSSTGAVSGATVSTMSETAGSATMSAAGGSN